MPTVSQQTYNGGLVLNDLMSSNQTILLGNFGALQTGQTLTDEDHLLTVGETFISGGKTLTMIGSGLAQPGVSFMSVIIPTGTAVDLIIAQDAGGQIYFIYPDGAPNLTGAIALVVDAAPVGYNIQSQSILCIDSHAFIRAGGRDRPIASLRVGDLVDTQDNGPQRVLWIGTSLLRPRRDPVVRVPRHHFDTHRPYHPLHLSPQHRLALSGPHPDLPHFLTAAKHGCHPDICALRDCAHRRACNAGRTDQKIRATSTAKAVEMRNILLPKHSILFVNGATVESLFPGAEVIKTHPELHGMSVPQPALPVLRPGEARRLLRQSRKGQPAASKAAPDTAHEKTGLDGPVSNHSQQPLICSGSPLRPSQR
ncbi:Hint domain-containing protein [Thioclava kandeliae]|uniref:Hint domain-containing protein n=1 Tax=Thioclava kandeliae TaxID=3070818 RepID=A0ABV1SJV2_9RHOB